MVNKDGSIVYLNSGDWIENLTSLEYNNGEWSIYRFDENETRRLPPKIWISTCKLFN